MMPHERIGDLVSSFQIVVCSGAACFVPSYIRGKNPPYRTEAGPVHQECARHPGTMSHGYAFTGGRGGWALIKPGEIRLMPTEGAAERIH